MHYKCYMHDKPKLDVKEKDEELGFWNKLNGNLL